MFLWIRLSDGVTVGNMSSLNVSVEGADDGGMYRCEVTNLAGNDSSTVTLNGEDCALISQWFSQPTNVCTILGLNSTDFFLDTLCCSWSCH